MVKTALKCALVLSLAGCASGDNPSGGFVERLRDTGIGLSGKSQEAQDQKLQAESAVLQDLTARRSVLPMGEAYHTVAHSVLATNARTAEAELRAAKLRARAASTNWLPRLGPEISLTSLGDVITSLVLDVTLFDHGRKKGEREFAKADVEVAAVTLSQDSNDRVFTALSLYLNAEEGREAAAHNTATLRDMQRFVSIMNKRVQGGVSDGSDLSVVRQKLAEIRASKARNEEATRSAMAELDAMTATPLEGLSGISKLSIPLNLARPLAIVMADAEKERDIAQAKVDRANALPGIGGRGRIGDNSGSSISTEGTFGIGTGARLKAIEAAKEAASRRVAQAVEDSNRQIRRLDSQVAAADRQAAEAAALTRDAKANLDLFQRQFEAGARQVTDVVSVYETFARQQERQITLKFEAARLRLELARLYGLLADGEQI